MNIVKRCTSMSAPEATWQILGKLLVVINYKLLLKGEGPLTLSKLIGTILTHYVATLGEDIEKDFNEVRRKISEQELPFFFSPAQLDAIASCTAEQLPHLVNLHWTPSGKKGLQAARATIRRLIRESRPVASRSGKKAEQLRTGTVGAAPETRSWVKDTLRTLY